MSYIAVGVAGAGAVVGGIKTVSGIIQTSKANKGIAQLNKTPIDQYSISPELQNSYNRAEAMTNQGFSGEEKAAFQQGVGREQAGAFQSAVDMSGGNLSSAIGSVLKAQNIGAQTDFAAQGARLRGEHIQQANELAGQIQNQKNLMIESRRQRRDKLEQAYGQAKQQGRENTMTGLSETISSLGNATGSSGATAPSSFTSPDPNQYR